MRPTPPRRPLRLTLKVLAMLSLVALTVPSNGCRAAAGIVNGVSGLFQGGCSGGGGCAGLGGCRGGTCRGGGGG